jgi:hypothetical protein
MRLRKPSPAMVVAVIALLFSVVGTGVAGVAVVSSLSKREKKQTRRIADKEIRRLAPGLSVKSAGTASTADTANALTPGTVHLVDAQGEPAFESGCTNLAGFDPVGFYKDREGFVHLQGAYGTCAQNATVFHLPQGFRPTPGTVKVFPLAGTTNKLNVFGAGVATGYNGAVFCEAQNCALDGITFRAGD